MNGQSLMGDDDNSRYPQVEPVTAKQFLEQNDVRGELFQCVQLVPLAIHLVSCPSLWNTFTSSRHFSCILPIDRKPTTQQADAQIRSSV